jgi:hypothetical protein
MRFLGVLPWLLAAAVISPAQYPPGQVPPGGQYPPGSQYPPNTYPPNTYPPNTYPPDRYPNNYPNRLPGNIPVPEIRLPRRAEKDKNEVKMTLASVDGALRKLGEKDMVLQAGPRKLLRFRLLAKTQFRGKDGDPIRDSLLHPGDQLSVQVNSDDEETAVRVTLLKTGNASERAAAELPFDSAFVRAPKAEDLSKGKSVTVQQSPETEPAAATANETEPLAVKPLGSDEQTILEARTEAATFTATLPNYTVDQVTTRYFSPGWPARWQKLDEITADVAYVDGNEDYRNIAVNGARVNRPPENSGTWSTGEFATTLQDVLSLETNAKFKRRPGEDRIAARQAIVFDFTVTAGNSHWSLISPDGRRYDTAFEGAIWIDKDTRRVLRIEQRTTSLPLDFPLVRAESILTYGFVKIENKPYLLPTGSENLACSRGSGACTRNVIEFKNYKKFTAESKVTFGK